MASDQPSYPTSFSRDEVERMAHGDYFAPGSPVLPDSPMRMIDRITLVSSDGGAHGKGQVVAEFDIDPEAWYFQCHFIGDPVMPGCLGLDGMWQTLGFYLAWRGHLGRARALGVGELKFTDQALPHNRTVEYVIDIKRVIERKLKMVIADGTMKIDGNPAYAATGLRVALF